MMVLVLGVDVLFIHCRLWGACFASSLRTHIGFGGGAVTYAAGPHTCVPITQMDTLGPLVKRAYQVQAQPSKNLRVKVAILGGNTRNLKCATSTKDRHAKPVT